MASTTQGTINDPKGGVAKVTCPTFEAMGQIPVFHRTYFLFGRKDDTVTFWQGVTHMWKRRLCLSVSARNDNFSADRSALTDCTVYI